MFTTYMNGLGVHHFRTPTLISITHVGIKRNYPLKATCILMNAEDKTILGKMALLTVGVLSLTLLATPIYADTSSMCPPSCACDNKRMQCNRKFPTFIPSYIKVVELSDIGFDEYVDGVFCKTSWNNVRYLSLVHAEKYHSTTLKNNTFRCLNNIESLKLMCDQLTGFENGTFLGLENLTTLDLTGCQKLCSPALNIAFADSMVLPNLSELILSNIGTFVCFTEIKIDQTLVDMLGERPIRILDLSFCPVVFVHPNLHPLCDTLTQLNLSYATFGTRNDIDGSKICESLQVLDLNYVHLPKTGLVPDRYNLTDCTNVSLDFRSEIYRHVDNLYVNGLFTKDFVFFFQNCSVSATNTSITNLEFSDYNFVNFDVTFHFPGNHLRRIVLANNNMENIGMNVLENLRFLHEIDLSENRLSRSKDFENTFQLIFRENYLLRNLYLSNNDFTFIPFETFKSNTLLSFLDLSENKLLQITFNVTNLLYLEHLDMRNNLITALNSDSMAALDTLYKLQHTAEINRTLEVDLRGNLFSCDCNSLEFVQWFVNSPLFLNKDQYTCEANDRSFPMTEMAIKAAKEDCERPIRRRRTIILSTLVPFITILCIIGAIVGIVKQRRKQLRRKRFKDHVRLLQDNDIDFRFLVFLSFSSEDDQFVLEHVLTPLQVRSS